MPDSTINQPSFFSKGNKVDLIFEGTWITRDGSKVKVHDGISEVLESKHEYLKGFRFPIDSLGKCPVSGDMDLVERDRTVDGYSV